MDHSFFKVIDRAEFIDLLRAFPALAAENALLSTCRGRVLAEDYISGENLPLVNRSCMDGYAMRAKDLFGVGESNPGYLEVQGSLRIDETPDMELKPGHCIGICTGGTLPDGADAVLMVEYSDDLGGGAIDAHKSLAPGENVMHKGEDAAQGEAVLPAGRRLRAQDVGLLAALGATGVSVRRRPRVGVISTGDELVPVEETPRPGQVRDVNSHALACLIQDAGGEATLYGLVKDDLETLTRALKTALAENDVVMLSGGSSVGVRDLSIEALESLPDSTVLAHGVALKPGKPTILARVGDKAVFGLPGQITSALVVMLVLGQPFLRHISGETDAFDEDARPYLRAVLASNAPSVQGREEFVRVSLEGEVRTDSGETLPHAVLKTGKSGLIKTLVQAHGLVRIPKDSEGLRAGAVVRIIPL